MKTLRAVAASIVILAGCSSSDVKSTEKTEPRTVSVQVPAQSLVRPTVVLMTDFSVKDDAVGLLRGVVKNVAHEARADIDVLDLTHEVPAFDVEAGARLLEDAPGLYPRGTVFVVVVDPGVGTSRRPIAVELENGSFLVGPDNGVLSLAMKRHGVREVRAIEDARFKRNVVSTTFHGRDVFAPTGAHLALSNPPFKEIGPVVADPIKLDLPRAKLVGKELQATVVAIDEPFGNLWTAVEASDLEPLGGKAGAKVTFAFGDKKVTAPLVNTFGDVKEGEPLAYWNSRGRLALALNMGDAARKLGVARGAPVVVSVAP